MRTVSLAAAAIAATMAVSTPAEAKRGVNVGILRCVVEPTMGFLIGSSTVVNCRFEPSGGGRTGSFTGRVTTIGLSVGFTSRTNVSWLVIAPGKVRPQSIEGEYVGASANASVILGLGANALVGGFQGSIGLQPLSVQAQTGLNLALGATSLSLSYTGR
jgi:hypothetical protein